MKNKFLKSLYFFICISFFVCLNFMNCGATENIDDSNKFVLILTGTNLLDKDYNKENLLGIQNEIGYTLEDLKNLEESTCIYSAINSYKTKSIFLGKGISLSTILGDMQSSSVTAVADDGYSRQIDMLTKRYYYPNINDNNYDNKILVNNMLIWEKGGHKGSLDIPKEEDLQICNLKLMIGQKSISDINNSKFVNDVKYIVLGEKIPSILKINEKLYRRSELMLLGNKVRAFTYNTQIKKKTVYVRGIEINKLLKGYDDSCLVKFKCVDSYETKELSIKELIDNNYMLAYEKGKSKDTIKGIYDSCTVDGEVKGGYLTLYGDNNRPVKMICEISVCKNQDEKEEDIKVNISRVKFISLLASLDDEYNIDEKYICKFDDVDESYKSVLGWACKNRLINGYNKLKFMPNKYITREQVAVILNRYITYKLKETSINFTSLQFEDDKLVSNYAKESVKNIISLKLMELNGVTSMKEERFYPTDEITKYDALKSLLMLVKFIENEGIYEYKK